VSSSKKLVFLDTNVILSALFSAEQPASVILNYFIDGKFEVAISQHVLEEVIHNIKLKLPKALPVFQNLLITVLPVIVENPSFEEIVEWSMVIKLEDAGILAAAIAVHADFLITGDGHFFESTDVAAKSGLRIVTATQFLETFQPA
jgi:putative PIN family toxin of toxin-antitoxin system